MLFYSSFKKWYTRLPAKLESKCVRITIKNALPSWRSIFFINENQIANYETSLRLTVRL
ncbi:hypothetical protein PNI0010_00854 [Streptococcus pneumoniae PNI0010]|nr:hypothetical protein PNI0002_00451 [Streptococcus pneumoniae PNI0002]ELU76781.1 hypothetical protein PNI0010_00854 [Streptococcus pneumoniae PNI0010]